MFAVYCPHPPEALCQSGIHTVMHHTHAISLTTLGRNAERIRHQGLSSVNLNHTMQKGMLRGHDITGSHQRNSDHAMQAMDRAHRIGQTRPVLVFRMATAHSVEGRLLQRANSKLMLERLVIKQVRLPFLSLSPT